MGSSGAISSQDATRRSGGTPTTVWRALKAFRAEWPSLLAVQVTESLVVRADSLAWEHGLRAYDAVHLSAALIWQEALGEPVTVATFDKQLWQAANAVGLATWPPLLD